LLLSTVQTAGNFLFSIIQIANQHQYKS